MNLRKFINYPNKKQKNLIHADIKSIKDTCGVISHEERIDQMDEQTSHDENCPKCRARKDMIVNKIHDIEGKSKLEIIHHVFSINQLEFVDFQTNPVNHCNSCGNEWKKFKSKKITEISIICVVLDYLGDLIINNKKNRNYKWKTDLVKRVLNNVNAESIVNLVYENKVNLKSTTKQVLKLKEVRKYYKSVYSQNKSNQKLF